MTSSFLGGIVTHPPPLVIIRDITNFAAKQRIQMANGSFPHCQTVHSVWPWFYLNGNCLIGFQDSLGAGMQPQSLMHIAQPPQRQHFCSKPHKWWWWRGCKMNTCLATGEQSLASFQMETAPDMWPAFIYISLCVRLRLGCPCSRCLCAAHESTFSAENHSDPI